MQWKVKMPVINEGEIEKWRENLILSAKKNLSMYNVKDGKPFFVCNYRVPEILRKGNEDAYTPRVVSIGPIHRGRPHLQAMERYKWKFLGNYLDRHLLNLESIVEMTLFIEYEARMCYMDNFDNIDRQEFSEMIMLDFIFIIELLKLDIPSDPTISVGNVQKEFDDLWIKRDITHDMMLLENQLPLPAVTYLFNRLYEEDNSGDLLRYLFLEYFQSNIRTSLNAIQIRLDPHGIFLSLNPSVTDIVDFLVQCHDNKTDSYRPETLARTHTAIEMPPRTRIATEMRRRAHSATELQEAGVKFSKLINAACLLDIKFGNGVLEIPVIKVDSLTETIFLNMMASEQSRRKKSTRISCYIFLISALVKSPKDVALLEKCGIIDNCLGDGKQVTRLFDNLSKCIVVDDSGYYFVNLYETLQSYSKNPWNQWKGAWVSWMRMLKRDYFSNPWTTISVIAAFVLLVLTVIQTVCSIIQL